MKLFLYIGSILSLFFSTSVLAQTERDYEPEMEGGKIIGENHAIYGKVVSATNDKALSNATVQLFMVTENKPDSLVETIFANNNGEFRFVNPQLGNKYKVAISAISHETFSQEVDFTKSENQPRLRIDVGNVVLQPAAVTLDNVVVTAQRPLLEMGIDRRIYNASQSLTAVGGTAIDILKNIPSVSVDIDGNVTLRKSSPQILIDGRPTILTMDQIPAETIDRVELFTNPSAKFDAASTGGVINIILKKNKRVGINSVVSAGIGYPGIFNGSINSNYRQNRFNFFLSASYNQSGGKANSETYRINKDNYVPTSYFNQLTKTDRERKFLNLRGGFDFYIDNRNTISISQSWVDGRFGSEETQLQEYLTSTQALEYRGDRVSDGEFGFTRYGTQLDYSHKFPNPGKEIKAAVTYNWGDRRENSLIVNQYFDPSGGEYKPTATVRNQGAGDNDQWTWQVDYINPIAEDKKIEMGFRSTTNSNESQFNAYRVNASDEIKLPLSNNYKYRELVNGAYFTFTNKIKSIGYQLGLRAEQSDFEGELIDSSLKFGYQYPQKIKNLWDALFPSIFLSKELSEQTQVQLNYSRRIRRPNFWNMNPFVDISDPVNLQQGNPALRPEFTDSYEFNYSNEFSQNSSFLGVVYFRNTKGDITRYSDTITTEQYEQLDNAAVASDAILNTFLNAQYQHRVGMEFTLQQKIGANFDFMPTFDLQYRRVKAILGAQDLSNEGFNWEGGLTMNYKIDNPDKPFWNKFSFQFNADYESPEIEPQGRRIAEFDSDLAIRKDFLKDKASLVFAVNDVFNTRRFGSIYDTENFYQDSYRRRNVRSFRLSFTYKFGDPNFSFNRRGGGGGGDDD